MLFSYKLFFSPGHLHFFLHSSSHTCFNRSQVRGSVSVMDQLSLATKQSLQDSAKKCICRLHIIKIFKRNWQQWNKTLHRKNAPYFVNKYQTVLTLTCNETAYKKIIYICKIYIWAGTLFLQQTKVRLNPAWAYFITQFLPARSLKASPLVLHQLHCYFLSYYPKQRPFHMPLAELPAWLLWSH